MSTVLITGANRGLGLEFVRQYSKEGWKVLACCRQTSVELQDLAETGDAIQLYALDVTDHASVDTLAKQLADVPVDVLLNNAGTYGKVSFAAGGVAHQAFGETDFDNWEQVLRVNLLGPMKVSEAFVEHVARSEQKKIITVSSMLGSMGLNNLGGMYAYRTSKAAVNMMMHSMGINLADRGIIAVAVHPGWAKTEMGGPEAEIEPQDGVSGLINVIAGLTSSDIGHVTAYDGQVLPY